MQLARVSARCHKIVPLDSGGRLWPLAKFASHSLCAIGGRASRSETTPFPGQTFVRGEARQGPKPSTGPWGVPDEGGDTAPNPIFIARHVVPTLAAYAQGWGQRVVR